MNKQTVAPQIEEVIVGQVEDRAAEPLLPVSYPAKMELPSRPFLKDGRTPNPDYDATLDPGSGSWQGEKYFDLREKQRVHIRGDYQNPQTTTVTCSINGYYQTWPVNTDQLVAVDFAERIIDRGIGWRVG